MSSAEAAPTRSAETVTYWDEFKEWLLPSSSFTKSETPQKDLNYARILLGIFYAVLTGVFVYTIVRLCYSGRIELFSSIYKVDFVEAPSLAFCPYNSNDTIAWPGNTAPWVTAEKFDLKGSHSLKVPVKNCTFDRNCGCADLSAFHLTDTARETVKPLRHPAAQETAMVFRESIQIHTNLTDPSGAHVLKVGIYDSFDTAPDWLYMNEGQTLVTQLELIVWTVIDISVEGLVKTLKGDLRAMMKNRHIFRYTSQQVNNYDRGRPSHDTAMKYEMKTFFVEETMSSHRAFSLYTVGVLFALIALRWVVVDAFFLAMMPEYQEKRDDTVVRELSPSAIWLRSMLCGCCLKDKDSPEGDTGERDPLLDKQKLNA
jgi:hypothetical protein